MPTTAREWLDLILDPGWALLFDDVVGNDPLGFPGYGAQIADARARTGCSESVLVGRGTLRDDSGRSRSPVVAISFEFGFLGGSMGVAAGERICRAFELAALDGLDVVALCASGGARMQEGMLALAQMPATIAARTAFGRSGRAFVAYLRNPTTGGVFASFANTADLLWAEPGATIGFAGPRVAETVTGSALPAGSHTAESAYAASLVDELVRPEKLGARLAELLGHRDAVSGGERPDEPDRIEADAFEVVGRARDPRRPTGVDYLGALFPMQRGGADPAIACGLIEVRGRRVMAIAQNRFAGAGRPTPDAYRRARSAIATAQRLRLPIVTFVDTPGAEPGAPSEADGIAREIALTFDALLSAEVPTVACVVGEGGSGGALALAACDRVLIQQNAIFSVIAPEGAAAILRRTGVETVAAELRLTAHDMRAAGLADLVVTEPGAPPDPDAAFDAVHDAIAWALGDIRPGENRGDRWRTIGRRVT